MDKVKEILKNKLVQGIVAAAIVAALGYLGLKEPVKAALDASPATAIEAPLKDK